ncbi:hypothetical protein PFICI_04286 [Pestalotiopsis fici W106-1]|uniref:Mitochondrial inner membrane protease subunit 2 n=1 Tax=Pestalotiopsis fici (strain W106-1 / CGMCC3.15140) TaxID=1229662 RepID=W3X8N8_PESFW|nr:uncharacterized protein PFICI_04286 [Pestalotiopsis fici W106-1]ETS82410.1 hypothetical protein PFICI_04286 [Pestalotiopsis fici W106-1]
MAVRSVWNRVRINQRWRAFGDFSFYMFYFATWIPVVVMLKSYVGEVVSINGPSMYPYLNSDKDSSLRRDLVWSYKFRPQEGLARGMIITFWSPLDPEKVVVKRIIGLEGDIIRTREPYPARTVQVPVGHIWVEGDGAARDTLDSETYGPISTGLVIGKATHILWPLHKAGRIKWWEYAGKFRNPEGRMQ